MGRDDRDHAQDEAERRQHERADTVEDILGEVREDLGEHQYPVRGEELAAEYGGDSMDLPNETESVGSALDRLDEEYENPEEAFDAIAEEIGVEEDALDDAHPDADPAGATERTEVPTADREPDPEEVGDDRARDAAELPEDAEAGDDVPPAERVDDAAAELLGEEGEESIANEDLESDAAAPKGGRQAGVDEPVRGDEPGEEPEGETVEDVDEDLDDADTDVDEEIDAVDEDEDLDEDPDDVV